MVTRVLHVFGQMNRSGAELRTVAVQKEMLSRNIRFDYVALSGKEGVLDGEIASLGGFVHYCNKHPFISLQLLRIMKSNNYSAIHSHVSLPSAIVVFYAWLAGVKIRISHFRNTEIAHKITLPKRFRNRILKHILYSFSTKIVGVCEGALDSFCPKNWRSKTKYEVIYNGFNIKMPKAKNKFWRDIIACSPERPIVLNLARMNPQKNQLRVVDIFAAYRKRTNTGSLVFVGREDEIIKAAILDRARDKGVSNHVFLCGERDDALECLLGSDIMLFPSEWEGLPGAVIESAIIGTPVLASSIPGAVEIKSRIKNVFTFDLSRSDDDWGNELFKINSDPNFHQILLNHEFPFSMNNTIERFANLYKND